jgi:protein-L-isoaspartate O-methyltransferase
VAEARAGGLYDRIAVVNQPPSAAPSGDTADGYALGRSEAETQRLVLQSQIYGPFTRQFLATAGVTAGMKVLDFGSGAGDVALLLAELVGPQGQVVGVDENAAILETAQARVKAAGWSNVVFQQGDIGELEAAEPFDAVVGRWVLMYVPDPAGVLRKAAACLRPGGILAFQEGDLKNQSRTYPPTPLHDDVIRWTTPPPGAPGPDAEMGPKLFRTFLQAGLPAPQLRLDAPIGGGPSWPGYGYLTATVRSLLPLLERVGSVTADEVSIDTLEQRLRAEVVERDAIQYLPAVIGAWSRV